MHRGLTDDEEILAKIKEVAKELDINLSESDDEEARNIPSDLSSDDDDRSDDDRSDVEEKHFTENFHVPSDVVPSVNLPPINLPTVIIRVEDKKIFERLANEDNLLSFRKEILQKLNTPTDEWNEMVEKRLVEKLLVEKQYQEILQKLNVLSISELPISEWNKRVEELLTEKKLLVGKLRQEILQELNVSTGEWDEIVAKLDLPPEEWKAGRIQVQIISDDEHQLKHYNDRINAIYDGAEFLVNSIEPFDPTCKRKLLDFLRTVTNNCSEKLKAIAANPDIDVRLEISHYQNSIADYTKYVLDVLRSQLNMPVHRKGLKKVDELREMLAHAEEFALAKKTKPAVVTISSLFKKPDDDLSHHGEFMAMIDKPENPFSDFADKSTFQKELRDDLIDLGVALSVLKGDAIRKDMEVRYREEAEARRKKEEKELEARYQKEVEVRRGRNEEIDPQLKKEIEAQYQEELLARHMEKEIEARYKEEVVAQLKEEKDPRRQKEIEVQYQKAAEARRRHKEELVAQLKEEKDPRRQKEIEARYMDELVARHMEKEIEARHKEEIEARYQKEVEVRRGRNEEIDPQLKKEIEAQYQEELLAQLKEEKDPRRQKEIEARHKEEVEAQRPRKEEINVRHEVHPNLSTYKPRLDTNPDYQLPDWFTSLSKEKQNQIIELYDHIDDENAVLPKEERKSFDHPIYLDGLMKKVMTIAFDSAVREELRAIQQNAQKQFPAWYKALKTYEKNLLKAFLKDVNLDTDLGTAINAISSKLRLIPVLSNYGTHTLITHIKKPNAALATTMIHAAEKRSSHAASRDVAGRGSKIRSEHAKRNVYKMLDDLMGEKFRELNNDQRFLYFTSPVVIHVPILYQTLITPFKEPDTSLEEDKQAAVAYMRKMIAKKEWFIEKNNNVEIKFELISTNHPLNFGKYLDPTSSAGTTGAEIAKLLSIVTGGMKIYGVHGIAHKNFKKEKELKESIKNHNALLQDNSPETERKLELLTQACISLARITDDKRISVMMGPYRELYLSSLEQIVTSISGGASVGSCVSGKDRKAIEIMHTDAMLIFFNRYGRLPPANPPVNVLQEIAEKFGVNSEKKNFPTLAAKKDSDEFGKIFAELYCSKHQQFLAGQNAPGSFGTKTPGMYLPAHLKKAVEKWYADHNHIEGPYKGLASRNVTKEDDIRATNNEINKIATIFPRLKQRLAKIFRRRPPQHVAPEEWQWKRSTMDNREIYSLNESEFRELNEKAMEGLDAFKEEQSIAAEKTGLFSHPLEAKKELMRVQIFQQLLSDASGLSFFQKNILLYAIMKAEHDTQLQNMILKHMQIPTLQAARYILASNIKRVMNVSLDNQIGNGQLTQAQRAQGFAELQTDITSIVKDLLSYVDQQIESAFDYKGSKISKQNAVDYREQMMAKSTKTIVSLLGSMDEANPQRITIEQAERHQERMVINTRYT